MRSFQQLSHSRKAPIRCRLVLIWLLPLALIQAHFDFSYEITHPEDAFPTKIKALLEKHPVQELHLAFVLGRWFADQWGPPPVTVTPSGATLRARFQSFDQPHELQQAWGNLTHALSGLFCASLNFLADASMVTMPRYAFPGSNPSSASPWLYGSLPREAVCTENLTPWLKLLPCQGRQGLTQLLDRPTLYAASFHSMQVHLTVHEGQKPTPYTEGTEPKTCLWNSTEDCAGPPKGAFSPVSLRQTMTLVIRPNQLHGPQPAGQLLGWGPPVQQNLTLHRLFNTPAVAACPKASHTHIYWQLPLSVYTSLHPGSPTLNASALDNKLYTFSPTPDAVIASSNSLFALYNLTTPVALDSSSTMAAKLLESSSSFATAPTDSSKIEDSTAQRCVQPSLTWHQQPNPWDPSGPPLQVQQMLAGRLGDRGTLVLHIRLGASAQSKQEQQRVSSSKDEHASLQQDTQHKQQAQQAQQAQHGQQAQKAQQAQHRQQAQQADNSAGRGGGWHEFCVFQMVPWHFQLLFHTLKLHVDGQETDLSSVVTAHTLQPAEGQGTTALIELCFRIPGGAQSVRLSIAFQKAFLTVFDHPPDANRGFDMPSALVTDLHAQPLHQAPWTIMQQEGADPKGPGLEQHHILQHLSTFPGQHIYSNGVLVPMPTPDFSMPYNVCCLSCTVLALYVMGINAAVFGKAGHEEADAKQNKAAKRRQLVGVLLLVLTFGTLAVSTDKSLQRQLQGLLGMGASD